MHAFEPNLEPSADSAVPVPPARDHVPSAPTGGAGGYQAQVDAMSPLLHGDTLPGLVPDAEMPGALASGLEQNVHAGLPGEAGARARKGYDGSTSIMDAVGAKQTPSGRVGDPTKSGELSYTFKRKKVPKGHVRKRAGYLNTNMVKGATTAGSKSNAYEAERAKYKEHAERTYDALALAWSTHCATYAEAWDNISAVLRAADVEPAWLKILKNTGVFALFAGVVYPIAGAITSGGWLLSTAVKGIVEAAGMKAPTPKAESLFAKPQRMARVGALYISKERHALMSMLTELGDREDELKDSVSPGHLFLGVAKEFAQEQARCEAHVAKLSTRLMEVRLWKSYLKRGGAKQQFNAKLQLENVIPEPILAHLHKIHSIDADTAYAMMGWPRPVHMVPKKSDYQGGER